MAKIKMAGQLARVNVNHGHLGSIGAGLSDPGISIDRHIGCATVRRGNYFVACDSFFRDFGRLFVIARIHNAQRVVALVGNQQ